jgi:hypothetical protein
MDKELALLMVHEHIISDVRWNRARGYYSDSHVNLYNDNSNLI